MRILIVDDDADDAEFLERAVRRADLPMSITHLTSGHELVPYLNNHRGDIQQHLILLDLNMPGLTGIETLGLVRAEQSLKQVAVVIFSASSNSADVHQAYKQGANSYISKPASIGDWLHLVNGLYTYWRTVATLPSL